MSRAVLLSRKATLLALWLKCGQTRAARDEAKETFDAFDPDVPGADERIEVLYASWVDAQRDYDDARDHYIRVSRAIETNDIEGQLAEMVAMKGHEAIL